MESVARGRPQLHAGRYAIVGQIEKAEMKSLFLILVLLSPGLVLAQGDSSSIRPKAPTIFWNAGLGFIPDGTSGWAGFSTALSFRKGSTTYSAVLEDAESINIVGGKYTGFGVLIGKTTMHRHWHADAAIGIGYTSGNYEDSDEDFHDYSTLSIPIRACIAWTPLPFIGLGLDLHGMMHKHTSGLMVSAVLELRN